MKSNLHLMERKMFKIILPGGRPQPLKVKAAFPTVIKAVTAEEVNMDSIPDGSYKQHIQPLHLGCISVQESVLDDYDDDLNDNHIELETPRKRRRLTHLSAEQKLLRRKMKNREAAQNARDRKKAKMDDLETMLDNLREENARLQAVNKDLLLENESLKLERLQSECSCNAASVSVEKGNEPKGSAALQALLQKGHLVQLLSQLMTSAVFARCLMTLSLIHFLNCWKKLSNQKERKMLLNVQPVQAIEKIRNLQGSQQWWGPHQQTWSPSKT